MKGAKARTIWSYKRVDKRVEMMGLSADIIVFNIHKGEIWAAEAENEYIAREIVERMNATPPRPARARKET